LAESSSSRWSSRSLNAGAGGHGLTRVRDNEVADIRRVLELVVTSFAYYGDLGRLAAMRLLSHRGTAPLASGLSPASLRAPQASASCDGALDTSPPAAFGTCRIALVPWDGMTAPRDRHAQRPKAITSKGSRRLILSLRCISVR
jgi:hypothetical protein